MENIRFRAHVVEFLLAGGYLCPRVDWGEILTPVEEIWVVDEEGNLSLFESKEGIPY